MSDTTSPQSSTQDDAVGDEQRSGLLEALFRIRWVSSIAVVFGALGASVMMIVGAVSTIDATATFFGAGKQKAFSEEAALATSTKMVSSLDEFLLGLVLFIFAYGVFRLFIVGRRYDRVPDWFAIHSVTDLKVKLLETIAILLAVVFLKAVLGATPDTQLQWPDLVTPIAVGIFALSILLIKKAH